jgi:hypothetical protein
MQGTKKRLSIDSFTIPFVFFAPSWFNTFAQRRALMATAVRRFAASRP